MSRSVVITQYVLSIVRKWPGISLVIDLARCDVWQHVARRPQPNISRPVSSRLSRLCCDGGRLRAKLPPPHRRADQYRG